MQSRPQPTTANSGQARLNRCGLSEKDGFTVDQHGHIRNYFKDIEGHNVTYDRGSNSKAQAWRPYREALYYRVRVANEHRYYEFEGVQSHPPHSALRDFISPSWPKGELPKYLALSKTKTGNLKIPTFFSSEMIAAYKAGEQVETLTLTEGEIKAAVASKQGIMCAGFCGVSIFSLCWGLMLFIEKCQVKNIVILYDNDAYNLSNKQEGQFADRYDKYIKGFGPDDKAKRPRNFAKSASKLAGQLFTFFKDKGLIVRVKVATINPSRGEDQKGIDDLLLSDPGRAGDIVQGFHKMRSNENFVFKSINKSNYRGAINSFFKIADPEQFFQYHKARLENKPFKFHSPGMDSGEPPILYAYNYQAGRVLAVHNPARIDLNVREFEIDKFISEQKGAVLNCIRNNDRVLIDATTGCGKTTLAVKIAKRERMHGAKVVFAVPKIALAEQLSEDTGFPVLKGHTFGTQLDEVLSSEIVISTYDSLHKLGDLEKVFLIVDEVHLVSQQYGFRPDATGYVYQAIQRAKKALILSGTPNYLLAKTIGAKVFRFRPKKRPSIQLKTRTFRSCLSEIVKQHIQHLELSKGQQHWLFVNDKQEQKEIREYLLSSGICNDSEVIVLNSEEKDSKAFQEIVKKQTSPEAAKIILTTSIIGEGVNIRNNNIQSVAFFGVRNPYTWIQFIARFRSMKALSVYDYRRAKTNPNSGFSIKQEPYFNFLKDQAKASCIMIMAHYEPEDVEHSVSGVFKSPEYRHTTQVNNVMQVDELSILHRVEQETISKAADSWFFARLIDEYDSNLVFVDSKDNQSPTSQETKAQKKAAKERKAELREWTIQKLQKDERTLCEAVYTESKRRKTHHQLRKRILDSYYSGFKPLDVSKEALHVSQDAHFVEAFKMGVLTELINWWVSLKSKGITTDKLPAMLVDMTPTAYRRLKSRIRRVSLEVASNSNRQWRKLPVIERLAHRGYKNIETRILDQANDKGRIPTSQAVEIVQRAFTNKRDLSISPEKAIQFIESVFDVKRPGRGVLQVKKWYAPSVYERTENDLFREGLKDAILLKDKHLAKV